MSSFKKIKKASKYADCKNLGKESLLKYYGVKTERREFVMHRILKVKKDGFYIVGDGQTQVEGPVRRDQIFGLVFCVQRKGKKIRPGDFWWEFFAHAWLDLLPLRPFLAKCYGILTGAGKRRQKNSVSK